MMSIKFIFTNKLNSHGTKNKQLTKIVLKCTGWPKSRYTVIKLFFMCFEVTSSALYVAQK